MNFFLRIYLCLLVFTPVLGSCQTTAERNADERPPESESADTDAEGFVTIFDGESLDGWEGDTTLWRVEDGSLVGEITPDNLLDNNSFIIWQEGTPGDFELKLEYRITDSGNSGINYRSERVDTIPHALRGYQADIDGQNRYTGQNYEEKKRTTLAYRGEKAAISSQDNPDEPGSLRANVQRNAWTHREVMEQLGESDSLKTHINAQDWNECRIVARGNHLRHYVNGVLMSEVVDEDSVNREMEGLLGVQVHVGPPMKVEYRNIRLKELE